MGFILIFTNGCQKKEDSGPTINSTNQTPTTYTVGQSGQGGIIFYDKGSYSNGWRYLEAASTDQSTAAPWGCSGSYFGATAYEIGTGNQNTNLIISGCPTAGIAARLCTNLTLNGYSDWFLPSELELARIYNNLYKEGIGGFSPALYWSSTEASSYTQANAVNFLNGETPYWYDKSNTYHVRAVRAF